MPSSSSLGAHADPLQQLLQGCRRVPASHALHRAASVSREPAELSSPTSAPPPTAVEQTALPAELDFFSSRSSSAKSTKTSGTAPTLSSAPTRPTSASGQDADQGRSHGPDQTFRALVPHPGLQAALARMRLRSPTPVQRRAITAFRGGSDVVAIAPTGSGKTLAYALPLILDHVTRPAAEEAGKKNNSKAGASRCAPSALVLAPTRELAHQIARVFLRVADAGRIPLRVVELTSRAALAGLSGGDAVVHVVVGTPMRVAAAADAGALRLAEVRHVVLDEADELFSDKFLAQIDAVLAAVGARQRRHGSNERRRKRVRGDGDGGNGEDDADRDGGDGNDVKEDEKKEGVEEEKEEGNGDDSEGDDDDDDDDGAIASTGGPRVHMFSATLPAETDEIARRLLPKMKRVTVSAGDFGGAAAVDQVASAISQRFVFVGGRGEQGKVLAVRDLLREGALRPPALLFVQSKDRAAELFRELVYDGVAVDAIHGDRTAAARATAVARFRAGKVWLLIATDIVARGLDFLAVNTVVNYDVPASAAAYVHRIGRTGRNGRDGKALTLFTEEDVKVLGPVIKVAKASGAQVPDWLVRVGSGVRADEARRLRTRPPKRRQVGGPNRASLKGRKRKRREDDSSEKGGAAAERGGGEE